jgi:hypothetical protein
VHWGGYYATSLDIQVDPQRRRFGCRESDFALQRLVECPEEKEESEDEIKGEVGALPTDVLARLNGNSAEEIAELEKEYDFTGVPLVYRDNAKKWYN